MSSLVARSDNDIPLGIEIKEQCRIAPKVYLVGAVGSIVVFLEVESLIAPFVKVNQLEDGKTHPCFSSLSSDHNFVAIKDNWLSVDSYVVTAGWEVAGAAFRHDKNKS